MYYLSIFYNSPLILFNAISANFKVISSTSDERFLYASNEYSDEEKESPVVFSIGIVVSFVAVSIVVSVVVSVI